MAIYEHKTRVRYSEVDTKGQLSIPALIDLFQNAATFQSEDLGHGLFQMLEDKTAWVLSSWQIQINKLPKFAEPIVLKTWSSKIKMSLGYREFLIEDEAGNILVQAKSLWVFISLLTGKPAKVNPDIVEKYGQDAPIDMEEYPRKISLPEEMTAYEAIKVPTYFLDTNNHVNNEKYIEIALTYLPENFKISKIRVEYKNQAHLDDIMIPNVKITDDCVTVALLDEAGEVFSTVQFIS